MLDILNRHYGLGLDRLELLRDGGSKSYIASSGGGKYFARAIHPALFDTALAGADIQAFLQGQAFPVTPLLFTKENLPYAKAQGGLFILYEFIEGEDCNPERDAQAIGALTGRLHRVMKGYQGELVKRDRHFYIGRYIDILRKKQYPRVEEYMAYGDALWEQIRDLPQGYCHGDLYDGNIRKGVDGRLYLHDFDTSCWGFPMYDPALICDMTKYFEFDQANYGKSMETLARFVPEYRKYNPLTQAEMDAFPALIALQHFSTQATIMEIYGPDCLDEGDMDSQLDWLYRWREQWGGAAP